MIDLRSNIAEVLRYVDNFSAKQYPFAVAMALTQTARAVKDSMPDLVQRELDDPTPFTKAGFYSTVARKDNLTAIVGAKDKQAEYLRWQVEGGRRAPKNKALRLPGDVQLNAYGNIPAGLIRQLVARAKAGKRATKGQAARFGVSQALDLFYGEPGDGRPAGIYKRVGTGTVRRLVPVIVFPKQSAQYERRLDFYGQARRVTLATFDDNLRRSWAKALASAR
jgi:hypothetical protein